MPKARLWPLWPGLAWDLSPLIKFEIKNPPAAGRFGLVFAGGLDKIAVQPQSDSGGYLETRELGTNIFTESGILAETGIEAIRTPHAATVTRCPVTHTQPCWGEIGCLAPC